MPNKPHPNAPRSPRAAYTDATHSQHDEHWYRQEDPARLDRFLYPLIGISVVLLLIDLLVSKHGALAIERFWGFYGIFGLVAGLVLVLGAALLRRIVMRPEDYHDR